MSTHLDPILEHIDYPETRLIKTWSLPETFLGTAATIVLYLVLVFLLLPKFMKNRQPYKLNKILMFYNAFQVAFSMYAVVLYVRYIYRYGLITSRCPEGTELQKVINEIWPYFIAKHVDLLDTVFFVLRKKNNQVTFLHVYHHSAMVTWTWFHLMYHPTDHFNVVGLINSFIHVIMYTYYWLSSLGPEYSKYLWWKKHVTKIQLIQFMLVLTNLHYQQQLSPCPLPPVFHCYCLFSISSFFLLFMNFYFKNYGKSKNVEHGTQNKSNEIKVE